MPTTENSGLVLDTLSLWNKKVILMLLRNWSVLIITVTFCLHVEPLWAKITLATLFRDGLILQRGKPVSVWGTADPGERLKVEFSRQVKWTEADTKGRWSVKLDPLAASTEPAKLVVTGTNTVTVNGVLVGEVWLCSGQSNMNSPVAVSKDGDQEIASARHLLIHYFDVTSSILEEPVDFADGEWVACSPETVARFSAVGYFFARELQREIKVPIGTALSNNYYILT